MKWRLVGKRVMLLSDTLAGAHGRRNSVRLRSLRRPMQINITVTRYRRPVNEHWRTD